MAFKFIAVFALMAVANAGILQLDQHHQHAHYNVEHHVLPVEHHSLPLDRHNSIYHTAPVAHLAAPQHHVLLQKHHLDHDHDHEEYPVDPHPQYNFAYDVQDAVSGDSKSQTESRDGDVVHGEYSLTDADGFRRTVKYTADSVNGFNAVVHREPLQHKIVASAGAIPVQYHHVPSTIVKSPISYSAPLYTALPAHHEQHHPTYTTYEVPAHKSHHDNTHQYQYHH